MSKGVRLKRNFMQSLALGEESSEVAQILENISGQYAEENEDKLKLLLGGGICLYRVNISPHFLMR